VTYDEKVPPPLLTDRRVFHPPTFLKAKVRGPPEGGLAEGELFSLRTPIVDWKLAESQVHRKEVDSTC